ncbi:MAG: winged helix DNA-binding domain-containing protein [Dehalococcoidia bacterium]|nr:winged helix DNA-binding domain-containing protein [Dehalococcoidia bacterium]
MLAWRMERQQLVSRRPREDLQAVVGTIGGLHAQVLSAAELAAWARVDGLRPGELEEELWERRSLVKLWAMRGTLHLLPAAEYGLWQAALNTYDHYLKGGWLRGFKITREELDLLLSTVREVLGGDGLTRDELAEAVAAASGSPALGEKLGDSWGAYLKPASFQGSTCFGPNRGRSVTFVSPGEWIEVEPGPLPDEAVAEVTRRYLRAYGPATAAEYSRWWGPRRPAQATRSFRALGEEVAEIDVEGEPHWALAGQVEEIASAVPQGAVRLLPAFDPYVIGSARDVAAILDPAHKGRVHRPQGWISPVLLVDGRIEGVWSYERGSGRLTVAIEPFRELGAAVRQEAEAEAERLAAFYGDELALEWV